LIQVMIPGSNLFGPPTVLTEMVDRIMKEYYLKSATTALWASIIIISMYVT